MIYSETWVHLKYAGTLFQIIQLPDFEKSFVLGVALPRR